MLPENFKIALKLATKALSDAKINYAVVGTTALAIHGMDALPRDLDLIVHKDDLDAARELFSDYMATDIATIESKSGKPAWGFVADLHGVELEVVGENNDGTYVSKLLGDQAETVDFEDEEITVFSLQAQAMAYSETQRAHKAKRIQDFLKSRK